MKKVRFSSHPGAKIRRQGPPSSARAQSWVAVPTAFLKENKNNLLLLPVKEYEDDAINQSDIEANKCCLWKEHEKHMNNSQLINTVLFVKLISQERNAKQTSFKINKKMGSKWMSALSGDVKTG